MTISSEAHELKDLQSMGRGITRLLLRWGPLTLLAEDGQLPFEQRGVPGDRITRGGQS